MFQLKLILKTGVRANAYKWKTNLLPRMYVCKLHRRLQGNFIELISSHSYNIYMKFKPSCLVLICLVLFCACKNNKKINEKEKQLHQRGRDILEYIKLVEQEKKQAIDDFIKELPLEERIAQLFVVNIVGCDTFTPVEQNIAGGFLYFSYNIADTAPQMIAFNKSIFEYCKANKKIPPFLTVDQEGGYVNRLRTLNTPLPSAERVANELTLQQASKLYENQAKQMQTLGFTMNLAPVTEVCTSDNEEFLMERSFGSQEKVISYGAACINAYESNGIATVLKHFPGNTNTDPHTGLPEIDWINDEMELQLTPFRELVKQNPTAVLMSHARVKGYDEKNPSCLSEYWVTDVLRNEFGFNGIIFSDDIFMGALADNGYPPEKAVVMAIQAGVDCIMISEKRIGQSVDVLRKKAGSDSDFEKRLDESVRRIIEYKIKCGFLKLELINGKYELCINYVESF